MEIKEIKDLKNYLSPNWLLDDKQKIDKKFEELAHFILEKTAIQKGDKLYFINDIEFYFYSDNHRDIITYPRNCKAGEWFFHPSGVDIALESNVEMTVTSKGVRKAKLSNEAKFGGILIRGISLVSPEEFEDEAKIKLDGPIKVMDTLFDKFDAFDKPNNLPKLIYDNTPRGTAKLKNNNGIRHNLLNKKKNPKDKVNSIMENYTNNKDYAQKENLVSFFKHFLNAPYRFVLSDK